MTVVLRDYQNEAIEALRQGWAQGHTRLAVGLPTGAGKTEIFSALVERALKKRIKSVVIVHRDELVRQAASKISRRVPGARVGIVKASENEVDADIVVASVQTLAREKRLRQLTGFGNVVVDEAHHALAESYKRALTHLGSFSEGKRGTPTSGWSATLARGDGRGLGTVWEKVIYEKDILWMIANGYLVDVKGKLVKVDGLDLGKVARSRGDFQEGDLGEALVASGAGEYIARAYQEHAGDRQGVLFAPTVGSAFAFADDMNAAGISTEVVVGFTDLEDRQDIYERFRTGKTQVLANCMVLTEGWDAPWCSCAVVARPTESAPLYIQMVGRILRPWSGKNDALVLDVVGAARRHKLAMLKDLTPFEVDPEEGETLREAAQRAAHERGPRGVALGEMSWEEVDLFSQSDSVWLRTPKGVMFIPTRDHYIFLWPQVNGNLSVGKRDQRKEGGVWLEQDLDLADAMFVAEQAAYKLDPYLAKRDARWRRKPPSDGQLGFARQLRLKVPETARMGDVSDMISIAKAAVIFDPAMPDIRRY